MIILIHRKLIPMLHLLDLILQFRQHSLVLLKQLLNLVVVIVDNEQLVLDPLGFPLLLVEF